MITEKGVKSCVNCVRPHVRDNYDEIIAALKSEG